MNLQEVLKHLESLSDEKTKKYNVRNGVNIQYGVKLGDIRKVAKKVKLNHKLALELWETKNFDARMLAILLMKPKQLSTEELDSLVQSVENSRVADWLNSYIVKVHPESETLREKWMTDKHPMAQRAGWNLTSIRIAKDRDELVIADLLDQIETKMGNAAPDAQWTMNFALVEIGINCPDYRKRALEIGEKLGLYRDYPTSKGCTSPFAPIWINEMVSRQGN